MTNKIFNIAILIILSLISSSTFAQTWELPQYVQQPQIFDSGNMKVVGVQYPITQNNSTNASQKYNYSPNGGCNYSEQNGNTEQQIIEVKPINYQFGNNVNLKTITQNNNFPVNQQNEVFNTKNSNLQFQQNKSTETVIILLKALTEIIETRNR